MNEPDDAGAPPPTGDRATEATDDRIDVLCAAVTSTARSVRGRSLFVGWTGDGRPAGATNLAGLSDAARGSLVDFQASGLGVRPIPYAAVVPMTYVLTGPAVDFADTAHARAEDQVRYTVTDARGERREIALGERTVLGAIVAARTPWQASENRIGAEPAVTAVPLYTVFAPLPGASLDTGLALLFEPTLVGASNEPAVRSFIRNTVGRLLVLDESQPRRGRKGYLEAAGRLAGTPPKGGGLQTLVLLRRMGLVDFGDEFLTGVDLAKRRVQGHFLHAMRALGMVDISDELLDELTHPRPDYDVDQLDTERLFDLAEAMYAVASRILAPSPPVQPPRPGRR